MNGRYEIRLVAPGWTGPGRLEYGLRAVVLGNRPTVVVDAPLNADSVLRRTENRNGHIVGIGRVSGQRRRRRRRRYGRYGRHVQRRRVIQRHINLDDQVGSVRPDGHFVFHGDCSQPFMSPRRQTPQSVRLDQLTG